MFSSGDKWSGCAARVHVLTQGDLWPEPVGKRQERCSAMSFVREQESAEAAVPGTTSRKTKPDGLTTREGLNLAGRHDHRWSRPGAMRPNRLSYGQRSSWQRKSAASFRKDCQEPPYADPRVRWCGSTAGKLPGDSINAYCSSAGVSEGKPNRQPQSRQFDRAIETLRIVARAGIQEIE